MMYVLMRRKGKLCDSYRKLGMGMSIIVVRHYGLNKLMCHYIKKNEDNQKAVEASAPSHAKLYCVGCCGSILRGMERAFCVYDCKTRHRNNCQSVAMW
jgi:hypothetical protein